MLLFIYRYIFGILYIRVKSEHPEKILNLCAENGIGIWRVVYKGDKLYFKIGISSFKKLRILKRKVRGKLHITSKKGLPFLIARNKNRYGIPVGIILFVLILNFLSGAVWNINISGNSKVSSEKIVQTLESIGIKEGKRIKNIDVREKRNELLLAMPELSWAALNLEGSKLTVDVKEARQFDEKDETPSNIKSSSDGIIKSVEVISGTAAVKVGQAVSHGDLLISGMMEYSNGVTKVVRARGNITAEVCETLSVSQDLKINDYKETGVIKKRKVLEVFGIKIPLYSGKINGSFNEVAPGDIRIYDKPYLPLRIFQKEFKLTEKTDIVLNDKQAEKMAFEKMSEMQKKFLNGGKIISSDDEIVRAKNKILLKRQIKCLKNINFEEKIILDSGN